MSMYFLRNHNRPGKYEMLRETSISAPLLTMHLTWIELWPLQWEAGT